MIYKLGETPWERLARILATLAEDENTLASDFFCKLNRCGFDWNGAYRCRLPVCPLCRRINIRKQQRSTLASFRGCSNSDLLFVSICLPGCRDVRDIKVTFHKGQQDLTNRLRASGLSDVILRGWGEIDAVSADQFPHIPPARHRLVTEIAPIAQGQQGPTWLPGVHAVVRRAGHDIADIRRALQAQWPTIHQVDVKPFNEGRTVENNLLRITSYANKFSSLTALRTDSRSPLLEPWPVAWDIELHSWLESVSSYTPFQFLRFSKGFNAASVSSSVEEVSDELVPLPFAFSFTEIPMHIYTGWGRG